MELALVNSPCRQNCDRGEKQHIWTMHTMAKYALAHRKYAFSKDGSISIARSLSKMAFL
jgi:hypothetical protein